MRDTAEADGVGVLLLVSRTQLPGHRTGMDLLKREQSQTLGRALRDEGLGTEGEEVTVGVLQTDRSGAPAAVLLHQLDARLQEVVEELRADLVSFQLDVLVVGGAEAELHRLEDAEVGPCFAPQVDAPLLHVDPDRTFLLFPVLAFLVLFLLTLFVLPLLMPFFLALLVLAVLLVAVSAFRESVFGVETAHGDADVAAIAEEARDAEARSRRLDVAVGHEAEAALFLLVVLAFLFVLTLFLEHRRTGNLVVVGIARDGVDVPGPVAGPTVEVDGTHALVGDRVAAQIDGAAHCSRGARGGMRSSMTLTAPPMALEP